MSDEPLIGDPSIVQGNNGVGQTEAAEEYPNSLVGKVIAERYRIERLIGVGGMGSVYRASHIHMRKTVALKTLHREMTRLPEAVARFEREAIAASRIEHANVAAATDFGRLEDGTFYLVLELIDGESLRQRLLRERRLNPRINIHIARQIASALNAAHSLGIVHRDLKPENVMIMSRPGVTDFVKVLDFGIAKVPIEGSMSGLTAIGTVMGTPAYMSPEQCAGHSSDARSDLYSLGVILYEMANGRLPFATDDPLSLLSCHLAATPDPIDREVPEPLAAIITSLLEKDPQKRIQSASALMQLIDETVHNDRDTQIAPPPDATNVAGNSRTHRQVLRVRVALRRLVPLLSHCLTFARSWARRPIRFRQRDVRLGFLVVGCIVGVAAFVAGFVATFGRVGSAQQAEVLPLPAPAVPTSVLPQGSRDDFQRQVERIEMLKVYERTERDWTLLARGYAETAQWLKCAQAYRSVLALRSSLKSDPILLSDLQRSAQDPEAFKLILNLSETVLGPSGVELIWQLWVQMKQRADQADNVERLRKKLIILSQRARPALRTALELDYYQTCPALEGVVTRASKNADQRSLLSLEGLSKQTGCGPRQEYDCTPCIRAEGLLEKALARARSTAAPPLGAE